MKKQIRLFPAALAVLFALCLSVSSALAADKTISVRNTYGSNMEIGISDPARISLVCHNLTAAVDAVENISGGGSGGLYERNVLSFTGGGSITLPMDFNVYITSAKFHIDDSNKRAGTMVEYDSGDVPQPTVYRNGSPIQTFGTHFPCTKGDVLSFPYKGQLKIFMSNESSINLDLFVTVDGEDAPVIAKPVTPAVTVDGEPVSIGAYEIGGYNYYKLRDFASIMNGTPVQFSVGYDSSTDSIRLTMNQPYTAVGGEQNTAMKTPATVRRSTAAVYMNGEPLQLDAYEIDGSNYYKLRDLASALGIYVKWNEQTSTTEILSADGFGIG